LGRLSGYWFHFSVNQERTSQGQQLLPCSGGSRDTWPAHTCSQVSLPSGLRHCPSLSRTASGSLLERPPGQTRCSPPMPSVQHPEQDLSNLNISKPGTRRGCSAEQ
jgi:hypothetical protein